MDLDTRTLFTISIVPPVRDKAHVHYFRMEGCNFTRWWYDWKKKTMYGAHVRKAWGKLIARKKTQRHEEPECCRLSTSRGWRLIGRCWPGGRPVDWLRLAVRMTGLTRLSSVCLNASLPLTIRASRTFLHDAAPASGFALVRTEYSSVPHCDRWGMPAPARFLPS